MFLLTRVRFAMHGIHWLCQQHSCGQTSSFLCPDAADAYSTDGNDFGYVESILHEAFATFKAKNHKAFSARIATKGGMLRRSAESTGWQMSGCAAEMLYTCIQKSRMNLMGKDSKEPIFLWQVLCIDDNHARCK